MKKLFKLLVIAVVVASISFSFSSCKEDTECEAVITVKRQSDTNIVVPGADIYIGKQDIKVLGVSDVNGQFRYTFKLEAILDVIAQKADTLDSLYGQTVIRLKPGETVYKTVFVNKLN
jgi:hypothetical protein